MRMIDILFKFAEELKTKVTFRQCDEDSTIYSILFTEPRYYREVNVEYDLDDPKFLKVIYQHHLHIDGVKYLTQIEKIIRIYFNTSDLEYADFRDTVAKVVCKIINEANG